MSRAEFSKGKCILKRDIMFIENVQRFADPVCSCDAPCCRNNSLGITDIRDRKTCNFLSVYTETNISHNRTKVNFAAENVNKE
jgi:hypothetical protein